MKSRIKNKKMKRILWLLGGTKTRDGRTEPVVVAVNPFYNACLVEKKKGLGGGEVKGKRRVVVGADRGFG